jgi:hypothetical protein
MVVRVVLVALVVTMAVGSTADSAQRTRRLHYSPFATDGSAIGRLAVTPHYHGQCNSGSEVVVGDVYRCFDGNFIRDPCYYDDRTSGAEGDDVVLCVGSPWSRSAVRLRVDTLDSSYGRRPGGPPWALELMNGERCVFAEGATNVVEGRRLNYTCNRSHYLWGSPDTSDALWRIRASRNYGGTSMRRLAIRVAWR